MIDCGMFCRGFGGFYVFFRRLQGLFAVKMRCENGEMVVDFGGWWCGCWVLAVWFLYDLGVDVAFGNL